jgi:predicted N-acetyltransferase YhbS
MTPAPGPAVVRIVSHEDVDPEQLFRMRHLAFRSSWDPEFHGEQRVRDARYRRDRGLCALEGDRLLGQVRGLQIPTLTRDGPETVGGLAGVATHPSAARRGVARALIEATHEAYHEDDVRRVFLLVGLLGFVPRQPGFFSMRVAMDVSLSDLSVVEREGRVTAYAFWRKELQMVECQEVAAATLQDLDTLMAHLESRPGVRRVVMTRVSFHRLRDRLGRRGYAHEPMTYSRVMAVDLRGREGRRALRHRFGQDEGRFVLLGGDDF